MPDLDITNSVASSNSGFTDFSVDTKETDAQGEQAETKWTNDKWSQYFGYYKEIPELKAVIDAKATWTVGKGFEADDETATTLEFIRGWGKDTFNSIIENLIRNYNIGGDAFAQIIYDDDGNLINLKPLDPGVMSIIVDGNGLIKRYEQNSKIEGKKPKKFQPTEIFHLARNRVADEIHGQSMVTALERIILMRNEAMDDWQRVLHHNIDPMIVFKIDSDDLTKIAEFKALVDKTKGKGQNMYIPKDTVEFEVISLAPNANLSPLEWIDRLNNYFFQAAGVPQIIVGGSAEFTEATAKIAYLAFQQTVEEEQLFVEEEMLLQLGLEVDFQFPASLENELLSDEKKDGSLQEQTNQPSETTAGEGQ